MPDEVVRPVSAGRRGPPDWYAEVFLAVVAWAGFAGLVAVHVQDVRRDLAQEAIRRLDIVRYAEHEDLHGVARAAQAFGMAWFVTLIAVVAALALAARGRWARARVLTVVTVVVLATVTLIKLTVRHPVVQHIAGLSLGSFPSGHTADVTAIIGAVLVTTFPIRWRLLAYAVSIGGGLAVGGTRVISGAHTPDDVTAGWLLGSALVFSAGSWLASRSEREAEQGVGEIGDRRRG